MRAIRSGVDIKAPAAVVWQILVDFARYPDWNPFITTIDGEPRLGARLRVRLVPHGRSGKTWRKRILEMSPPHTLSWSVRSSTPFMLSGTHSFIIEDRGDTCHLTHEEIFRGLSAPFLSRDYFIALRSGFEEMNAALKYRAEALARDGG